MDANVRAKEEEIVKDKLGEDAKDIDLSGVSDDELEKAVTTEDKKNQIKKDSGVEELNTDSLSEDQLDQLMSKLSSNEEGASLSECIKRAIDSSVGEYEENTILEALHRKYNLKISEAQEIFNEHLKEHETFIDHIYNLFKESEECPHVEDLIEETGEKVEGTLDIPEMEYANKKEAKTVPDPVDLKDPDLPTPEKDN
jgi:hypothetical protein